jgi:two-component system LytT family response regulator
MQGESGFDLLPEIGGYNGSIIFVTAYEDYSLKALKAGALDYLLKPIDIEELQIAVHKAADRLQQKRAGTDVHRAVQFIAPAAAKQSSKLRCITISGQQGFEIVPVNDIVFIEADGNYSVVYLTSMHKIVATRQMGEFEDLLAGNSFFRIHKSAIINLRHLRSYDSREGHVARMTDGSSVAISGRRLSDFMKAVDQYAKET